MNYYPFHVGDYAAHTRHLSMMGDLAYRRLLDLYYLGEGPLPLDPVECARKIGMRDYINDVSEVLSDFFLKSEDGWHSKRADEEIAAYQAKAERAKSANKKRWVDKKSDSDLKSDKRSDLKSDASRIPTNNQEPITNNSPSESKAPRKRSDPPPAVQKPEDVAEQTWADWLALRKAKRAPVTSTVVDGARKEAELAGMQLDAFLQVWCMRGSQGLQADWLKPAERQVASRVQQMQTFRERDREAGMRRWEEMTGQRHPDRDRMGGQVIDTTAKNLTLLETSL